MINSISASELISMMIAVSNKMIGSLEILTEADKMGDGDHGVGMKRGFEAIQKKLISIADTKENTIKSIFTDIGTALLMNAGGASGAIFGTMYRSGAKNLEAGNSLDSLGFASFLRGGLDGVMDRGKAKPGDKTVVDALSPAAEASEQSAGEGDDLSECMKKAAEAADAGVEFTKTMVATTGKAKTLGERTIGFIDPGALSVSIMLRTMSNWIKKNKEQL